MIARQLLDALAYMHLNNVTHRDLSEFLPIAAEVPLHVETQTYPLEAANEALNDLRQGDIRGAKVLPISS